MARSAAARLSAASGLKAAIAGLTRAAVSSAVMKRGSKPGDGEAVGRPLLGVDPSLARGGGRVAAAAGGEHDEIASAQKPFVGRRVQRESWRDEVIDPSLDRARRAARPPDRQPNAGSDDL